ELEQVIAQLCKFQKFHPYEEAPFEEEFFISQLKSRALDLHLQLNSIIEKIKYKYDFEFIEDHNKIEVQATDWTCFINRATKEIEKIQSKLRCKIKMTESDLLNLVVFRDITFIIYSVLKRIKIANKLNYFVTIQGYIPSKLESTFKDNFHEWYHDIKPIRREGDTGVSDIPTLLDNPKFIKTFEDITIAQGIPKYREIDPTPLIAFIFPIFYGIMFPDLGQGLILILFGRLLLSPKIKISNNKRKYRYWSKMMISFGICSSVIGLLTGTFFGLSFAHYYSNYGILPLFNFKIFEGSHINIDAVVTIIITAIVIGTFHLALAYVIAMINKLREQEYAEALMFHFAVLAMYSFGILFALSFIGSDMDVSQLFTTTNPLPVFSSLLSVNIPSSYAAIVSVPAIVISLCTIIFGRALISLLSTNSTNKFYLSLTQGLTDIAFIPIVFLTNTISYSRLGIFLIMHSAMMGLVNGAWSYGIAGLPAVILGNIAVMILEGFLVYIQDLRLHLYEWLTKFTDDSNTAILFTPVKSESDLVSIIVCQ
ncbi:MAG TPA: V-type ATPase 116kDa subunit family protein, partial [Nitrososphaeraceae archaeon]|nr:V-type ATPase 116kDa subunit family protein [Nitrososphaeraceae archaeon]